ncbi:bifunctional demethylmenaquinone methyltransferase/2-methoxy-6-polyprenyl-1,4-benzoquinol methylase UbiE [Bdellovibrio sp. NC01]|uniref:bifunctional demethylmenaquinone methyltransferase/2-methoxy-6-polyprenyl-1,4-benzoquinol methylase UbiE n=1 Tax=Bdellovibrio sp. NC01 TaxID=2220073 RepID=UPI001157BE13|nr:bifunctional demethylmenaquinone methyltransferase/2-methoxy-6-polyprenyl-1,4-benzoquinol methylase UbiE [Bdellovibrio sp. NC01]QDK39181.1 bifunctional demethylmenaquinone methyltransferase/2-methoxy-6-polyprenyl-1,4-benzoquinol methylase UbiE [Bdellovibrio sp. NC01]
MHTKHSPNPEIIRNMFSKVAANYDKGNNVLSMGVHHLWRKKLVKYAGTKPGQKVLDCATGTGDLAIEFKKTVGADGAVIGTDFCAEMLIPAPGKAKERGLEIQFEQADVTQLQYADKNFDITSISFGIRNVGNPVKALQEMGRVTKSGGHVMVLEFGQVNIPVFGPLYNFYSQNILPKIGGLVTGQKDAYEYLQKSSAAFPCREGFIDLMKESGQFSKMEYISLTGGIAYIYKGTVK